MAFRNVEDYLTVEHPHIFSNAYVETDENQILPLPTAGQYYPIVGPWTNRLVENYSVSANGILTFTGPTGVFHYAPSITYIMEKACTVTFATFKNDVLLTETAVIQPATNLNGIVSRSSLVVVETNDTHDIRVKTTIANNSITIGTSRVVYHG